MAGRRLAARGIRQHDVGADHAGHALQRGRDLGAQGGDDLRFATWDGNGHGDVAVADGDVAHHPERDEVVRVPRIPDGGELLANVVDGDHEVGEIETRRRMSRLQRRTPRGVESVCRTFDAIARGGSP
jgi:hypothetical protein